MWASAVRNACAYVICYYFETQIDKARKEFTLCFADRILFFWLAKTPLQWHTLTMPKSGPVCNVLRYAVIA